MKIKRHLKLAAILSMIALISLFLFHYSHRYAYKETAVPAPVKLSPRLQALFRETKILCFGRYAIEVPQEAHLIAGNATLRSGVEIVSGGLEKAKRRADEQIKKLKWEDDTAEITYIGAGPIDDSWQVRYFEDIYKKERN